MSDHESAPPGVNWRLALMMFLSYLTAQAFIDRIAGSSARAAAQGLLALATLGIGHLAGALLSSWGQIVFLTPPHAVPPPYDWSTFWLLPCLGSILPMVLTALCFHEKRTQHRRV